MVSHGRVLGENEATKSPKFLGARREEGGGRSWETSSVSLSKNSRKPVQTGRRLGRLGRMLCAYVVRGLEEQTRSSAPLIEQAR